VRRRLWTAGVLFICYVISEYGEPRWNYTDREPSSLLQVDQRFIGAYFLHHQGLIALMMEVVRTPETSIQFYESTRRYNPECCHLRTSRHENLKSYFCSELQLTPFQDIYSLKFSHLFSLRCTSRCIFNKRYIFVANECTCETTSGCRAAQGLRNISWSNNVRETVCGAAISTCLRLLLCILHPSAL
jgi:hypothetical protein